MPPLNGWTFSQHALERALDMALDAEVIREVLLTPKVKQPNGTGYGDGCEVWAGERIALVVHPADRVVVTILWRGVTYERGTDTEPYRD